MRITATVRVERDRGDDLGSSMAESSPNDAPSAGPRLRSMRPRNHQRTSSTPLNQREPGIRRSRLRPTRPRRWHASCRPSPAANLARPPRMTRDRASPPAKRRRLRSHSATDLGESCDVVRKSDRAAEARRRPAAIGRAHDAPVSAQAPPGEMRSSARLWPSNRLSRPCRRRRAGPPHRRQQNTHRRPHRCRKRAGRTTRRVAVTGDRGSSTAGSPVWTKRYCSEWPQRAVLVDHGLGALSVADTSAFRSAPAERAAAAADAGVRRPASEEQPVTSNRLARARLTLGCRARRQCRTGRRSST
jgi:hypothetical protein